jgi:hypothetical protein
MYDLLEVGEEVSFPGLLDIRLIVEDAHEIQGNIRCKYFDDHLRKYIRLTLPANQLVRCRQPSAKPKVLVPKP